MSYAPCKSILAFACVLELTASRSMAQAPSPTPAATARPTHQVSKATSEISVDGALLEDAWENALSVELSYETNPGENVQAPVKTECLVTYDDRKVYVAFRAHDPDPKAIRAHLTDRDNAYSDDFVGVVFDTFNDQRRGFEFFVNPLGVQMDLTQDDVSGNEDDSWDTTWEAAGKVDPSGYTVELAVPWSSLRFPRVDGDMTWGFDAIRIYPRNSRHRIGLHALDRNVSCYLCQASKLAGFTGVSPGKNMEFDPTLTTQRTDSRDVGHDDFPNVPMEQGSIDPNLGLTARWGVTPNLTLNAAINPDFSQVETDAAQLDINTTFALFFPEKRPFFLEGADFFQTPLQIVYTRTIADPDFGLKVSGKQGKSAFGLFATTDAQSTILIPGSQSSDLTSLDDGLEDDLGTAEAVVRYRRDIAKNSTVGVLFTDREGQDYFNRVLGADGLFRFTKADTFRFQVLGSQTSYPDALAAEFDQPEGSFTSHAIRGSFVHAKRTWDVYATYQDLGKDFRADLGFVPQVDFRQGVLGLEFQHTGKPGAWLTRHGYGTDVDQTNEQDGTLLEREWEAWFYAGGPMQSFINLDGGARTKTFEEVEFDQWFLNTYFEISPSGSYFFYVDSTIGDAIDFSNVEPGTQVRIAPGLRFQFGRSLRFNFDHTYQRFDREEGRLFLANLSQMRVVYQFNIRTFVRAILQYTNIDRDPTLYEDSVDAQTRELGTQLLFSYKLNPQTVVFLGYSDNYFGEGPQGIDLTQTDRTLFLKVGYAWSL